MHTEANVHSFADVEDTNEVVTYKKGKRFLVHLHDRYIMFHRRKKLYVADFSSLVYWLTGICT
jgi:hypothetical protein